MVLKSLSGSTPARRAISPLRYSSGTSAGLAGRSRTWPIDDSTTYSDPRNPAMVRALAGDSTMTSGLGIPLFQPWTDGRRRVKQRAPVALVQSEGWGHGRL